MLFVLIGCLLIALKLFQVSPFAMWSWWWVVLPLMVAVIWFELIEPMFGLDLAREKREYDRLSKRLLKPVRAKRDRGDHPARSEHINKGARQRLAPPSRRL